MSKLLSTHKSIEIPEESPLGGALTWKHELIIGHKNMHRSTTELPNECTHKPWGLSIIIIIKLRTDKASAIKILL